jgi:hypothetical protein
MNISVAERRQIENEMIFRRVNEKVGDDIGALDALHIEDNNIHLMWDEVLLLRFRCECSDENCDVRIPLTLHEYQKIHEDRDAFIVRSDHQVDKIEKVIMRGAEYNVVRKNNSTAEPGVELNKTTVDNSQS